MATLTKHCGCVLRTLKVCSSSCHDISRPLITCSSTIIPGRSDGFQQPCSVHTSNSNRFECRLGVIGSVDFAADVNSTSGISNIRCQFLPAVRPYATADRQKCWKCNKLIDATKEQFFCECGVIQPPQKRNYFHVMGIEESYDVDPDKLQTHFRELQRILHPDKFGQSSKEEQEFSQQQSTLVNQAYRTLQKPYTRGLYMLELNGQAIDEQQIEMDPGFLANIMELNEQIMDDNSEEFLRQTKANMSAIISQLNIKISSAFRECDYPAAKQLLAQIKYYVNIEEKVDDLLESSQSSN